MKTFTHSLRQHLYTAVIMLAALCGFTSCDEDEIIGYNLVQGHWFGDLDMYYGNEKAHGSEITFTPWSDFITSRGTGVEVDYYYRTKITHYFEWHVLDGIIYLEFADDHNLDCIIRDYSISSYRFRGWLVPWDSWTGEVFEGDATRFDLRDYNYYWGTYGYSGYGDYGYYTKGELGNSDAISDSSANTSSKPIEIRGRNRAKKMMEAK